jgi:hypothetical protein
MTDAAKQSGTALEKEYQFMLWLMPTVEKFPRSQKFLLGDRMQSAALDSLESLVEATCSRNRSPVLSPSSIAWRRSHRGRVFRYPQGPRVGNREHRRRR